MSENVSLEVFSFLRVMVGHEGMKNDVIYFQARIFLVTLGFRAYGLLILSLIRALYTI